MKQYLKHIVLLVIVVGIIPFCISCFLNLEYNKLIKQLNTRLIGIDVAGEFNIGWLQSSAKTIIKSKANNKEKFVVEFIHTIKNGPIIISADKKFALDYKLAVIDTKISSSNLMFLNKALYADKASIEIVTVVEYNGALLTEVNKLPFTKKLGNGQIEFGGMKATYKYDRNINYLNSVITLPRLSYKEAKDSIELKNIMITGEQKSTALGPWDGRVDVGFKQFAIKSQANEIFTINDVNCSSMIEVLANNVNVAIKLNVSRIFEQTSNQTAGPFTVAIEVNNIDGKAMQRVQELEAVILNDSVTATNKENDVLLNILQNQPKLVVKNTEFNLLQGKVTIDAEAKIGDKNMHQINKPALLKTLAATVKVEFTKALVYELAARKIKRDMALEAKAFNLLHDGQAMPQPFILTTEGEKVEIEKRVLTEVAKLVAYKMIVETPQTFFFEISIKDSVMMVNGKEIPLNF